MWGLVGSLGKKPPRWGGFFSELMYIRGRFDIVAVNRKIQADAPNLLWILVVESKNMGALEYVGIAQMLTYAYKPTYRRMPSLNLLDGEPAGQLLPVLKAVREWVPGEWG
jgi:hypothetical protein